MAELDKTKRLRKTARSTITRTVHELEAEVLLDAPDHDKLNLKLITLEQVLMELMEFDQKVLDLMLDANNSDDEMEAENLHIMDYREKANLIKIKVNKVISPPLDAPFRPPSPANSRAGSNNFQDGQKKPYRLPKIELKKFNGNRIEWLGWWSQFEKIHLDDDLHATDKFQYLIQATSDGTRARKLVESYPQTEDNYPKVIETLKDRFGDKVLLTEVYVRKLLNLALSNVGKLNDETSLSNMYDELESNLRALESLGVTADQSAAFLYPMVESSLPKKLVQVWQRSSLSGYEDDQDKPTNERLKALMKFLKIEVKGAERLSYVKEGLEGGSPQQNKNSRESRRNRYLQSDVATAAGLFTGQANSCIFCDKGHPSQECGRAFNLTLQVKRDKIKEKKVCFQCLKKGHVSEKCKAFVRCPVCAKRHHTIICPELPMHKSKPAEQSKSSHDTRSSYPSKTSETQQAMSNLTCTREVLLETLLVKILGPRGGTKIVRLIFDNGSQRSYIRKDTAKQLKLQPVGEALIQKSLFTGIITDAKKHNKYNLRLENLDGSREKVMEVLDEPTICGGLSRIPPGPWIEELMRQNVRLNDFKSESPLIEILIGSDFYGQCLTGKIIQLQSGLTAKETIFGWTLSGKLPTYESSNLAMTVITMLTGEHNEVQDLWNLDAIGITDSGEHQTRQEKELAAKQHFLETVSREDDGRYSEWEEEGIIETVRETISGETNTHYLPHRPVFKPDSLTTPVRPVFDASCKIGRNPSLNDCLEKGPNLLEQIPTLLLRFREKKIGVISDIRKAFLMVGVSEDDRDFLRFLWWEDASCKSLKIYRHRRVVFGVTCSPFLLAAVMEHHLDRAKFRAKDKEVAMQLHRSIYVDNCVTSVNTMQEYEDFKATASKIMADARMELRQWEHSSGWESGVSSLPPECGLDSSRTGAPLKNWSSVLGLRWNKETDTLSCDFEPVPLPEKITKRKILSHAQQIYDPIGFLAPALLMPKMILQEAWATKTGWDEELDNNITDRFEKWAEELNLIPEIKIPRRMGQPSRDVELHVFSDASKYAFATAIFLRTTNNGVVNVQLLLAKSRVAPIKKVTIPRLELLGCLIGARLNKMVMDALDLKHCPLTYWTDSTTALSWIKRNDEWGTFVGNRVREICQLSSSDQWRHVPGIHNPADLPSRGCSFSELLASQWWEGPVWLRRPKEEWPMEEAVIDEAEISKEKKKSDPPSQQMLNNTDNPWYCNRQSKYFTNLKVMAWILRFIQKCRKTSREFGSLTAVEIGEAEMKIFGLVQQEVFPLDEDVIAGIRVTKDPNNLIHVKTKLINRADSDTFRYPVLLPNKHPLVDQLIRYTHQITGHAGVQILMGKLREKCWIVHGRKAIRNLVRSCVLCRRFSSKSLLAPEAPLPENRVKSAKVFEVVGVDLAGPLQLKNCTKTWFVIFTCAIYRAVHLELVDSLSTDAFLMSFSRFVSRRGRPSIVYSDNGTNFKGAANIIRSVDWKRVSRELNPIQWIFNPPSAAWWGGWWERLIRSIKDLLKRMLGNKKLSYIQLLTKLCEVEAIINSRPLTYVTEDQDDLIPLTPAMFLKDLPDIRCPESHVLREDGLRRNYKQLKTLSEELQLRFRNEYLALLVHRGKSNKSSEFNIGDVVLIGDDNKKRLEWPMGRIAELFRAKDGHVRVARVKTIHGHLTRPIQRLFPLEVSSSMPEISPEVVKIAVKKKETASPLPNYEEDRAVSSSPVFEPAVITRSGRRVQKPDRLGL